MRLLVVFEKYWLAILRKDKVIEFRSSNHPVSLSVGQCLLFALSMSHRRKGKDTLVCARVSDVQRLGVDHWIKHYREERAGELLEMRSRNASAQADVLHQALSAIQLVEDPEKRAKLLISLQQASDKTSQDMLDRAGVSKISKSMRVTTDLSKMGVDEIRARLQAIRGR